MYYYTPNLIIYPYPMRYTAGMAYLTKPGNLQYVDAGTFPAINDVYSYTPYKRIPYGKDPKENRSGN